MENIQFISMTHCLRNWTLENAMNLRRLVQFVSCGWRGLRVSMRRVRDEHLKEFRWVTIVVDYYATAIKMPTNHQLLNIPIPTPQPRLDTTAVKIGQQNRETNMPSVGVYGIRCISGCSQSEGGEEKPAI